MSEIDMDRAQVIRRETQNAFAGESIHDIVGALEMIVVDVLAALPGMDEAMVTSAFEAVARDVRAIIKERFGTGGRAH